MPSTFDIVPALGHGLVTAQAMPGGYDAIDDRRFWGAGKQEGSLSALGWVVSQRLLGANLTVDIASELGNFLVQGDNVTNQGLYFVPNTPIKTNLDLASSPHPTLPRIDQVVLEARDSAHTGDGITRARVYTLSGTATSGATLDNRTGAAALPASTVRLADVLVGAAAASIVNANIRDRRPWANGAYVRIIRDQTDYTRTNTQPTPIAIDATNLVANLECSGVPLKMTLTSTLNYQSGGSLAQMSEFIDGVAANTNKAIFIDGPFSLEWVTIPTAGWHVIAPYWSNNGATGSALMRANGTQPLIWTVEEILSTSATN